MALLSFLVDPLECDMGYECNAYNNQLNTDNSINDALMNSFPLLEVPFLFYCTCDITEDFKYVIRNNRKKLYLNQGHLNQF